MGRFVLVECSMWEDLDFRGLSTDSRLLFMWAWMGPRASISGLHLATVGQMRKALQEEPDQADENRVHAALDELAQKPLALYDYDAEMIWVVNRARHANRSPKVARSMQREVEQAPPTVLIKQFARKYGQMLQLRVEADPDPITPVRRDQDE